MFDTFEGFTITTVLGLDVVVGMGAIYAGLRNLRRTSVPAWAFRMWKRNLETWNIWLGSIPPDRERELLVQWMVTGQADPESRRQAA